MKRLSRFIFAAGALLVSAASAFGQGAILQGGPWTPGHVPIYVGSGSGQAIVQDSGSASGAPTLGVGLAEQLLTVRNPLNVYPAIGAGSGPLGSNFCDYDAPINNVTGYHYICLSPNPGQLIFGFGGAASPLPFSFNINGTAFTLPSSGGSFATVVVPTTNGSVVCFSGTIGLLAPCPGITNTQLATVPAATFKGNPTASANVAPTDFTIQGLPARGAPDANNDKIPLYNFATGAIDYVTPGLIATAATAGVSSFCTLTGAVTATQATTCLNLFTNSLQGLVPASSGGTTNFLRADGTFAAPPTTTIGGTSGQIQYNNAGALAGFTMSGDCTTVVSTGVITCTKSNGVANRIRLTAPTTFNVSTAGTDVAGCGLATGSAACRTRGYLYNILAGNYDFGNQTVTVQIADGTYTDSLQASGSLILGQAGPSGLIFTGNCTTPTNVLIQPAASAGYTYSADGGTSYRIQCQKLDQTTGVRASASNDMIVAGHGSRLYMGNPSLFGVRGDMVYGCNVNPYNTFTVANSAYLEIDNDFTIDVSACQVATAGTPTSGSAVIAIPSTINIVRYMGIVATGIPSDAYANSIVTNTSVTIACLYTSPCQATSSPGSETITFTGGGQTFIDWDSSQAFFITNGDPSYSIIGTLANFPFYTSGWFFVNDQSLANAQAITWVNPGQGRGACSQVENLSILNTNFQGIPYLPCNGLQPQASPSSTVTAGSSTFVVSSATGIKLGMVATDVTAPTATWTAGASTMVVSSATGLVVGAKVTGPGILTGAIVTNISGTTITIGGCGGGPRCVTSSPLYISEAGVTIEFSNGLFSGGSAVTGISGTTITISDTIKNSGTAGNVWFQGNVINFSLYK